MLNLILIYLLK